MIRVRGSQLSIKKMVFGILVAILIMPGMGTFYQVGVVTGTDKGLPSRTTSFVNVSKQAGLEGIRGDSLAWGDYNNDGYLDLLIRGPSSNLLFRNNGPPNWDFTDVSNRTGVNITRGYCKWADYDGDGYLDFYSAFIDDRLFRNNGPPDWDFTDVTEDAGYPSDDVQSEAVAWGDYNRDGYPDIFTVGWRKPGDLQWPYAGEPDRLYRNNGDGTFTDVSLSAGLEPRERSYAGMGVVFCDPNEDRWPDIYVSNYHLNPNQLWINNRDGTFTEMAFEYNLTGKETDYQGTLYYGHCNGAGWADIDNDLDMDLFVSHLAHKDDERSGMNRGAFCADSQIFLNSGPPNLDFTDIREEAGIPITPSGTLVQDPDTGDYMWKDEDYFGVAWGDMDNDMDLDLWVPQVKTYSFWDHSFLWRNEGDLRFVDRTDETGLKVWSNTGGTWVDFDNDGDLDFCTEGTYPFRGPREIHLFRNQGSDGHWIEIDLKGAGGHHQSSTDASGARVEIYVDDVSQVRYVGGDCGGHGFQQPQRLHFGLGDSTRIDEIWIYWPSGRIQRIEDVSADRILEVEEPTTSWVDLSGPKEMEVLEDESVKITVTSTGARIVGHMWDHGTNGWDPEVGDASLSILSTEQGPRWIRYRAEDENGVFWELEPIILNVVNVPPMIDPEIYHRVNESEYAWIEFNLEETPSDIESLEYYLKGHGSENWEWIANGTTPRWPVVFHEMGEYQIQIKAVDDDGSEDIKTIGIDVVNMIPNVNLQGDPFLTEDSLLQLLAVAEDSPMDRDKLMYRFHSGDGRTSGWQQSNEYSFKYVNNGTFNAAVEVMDRHGDIGTDEISIIVMNLDPEIELLVNGPLINAMEDETLEFEVRVTDTANDEGDLEILWDTGETYVSQGWGTSTTFRHAYTEQGTYMLNVSVRDDDGATATCNVTVDVKNVPPDITIVAPSGNRVKEDSYFTISGIITDTPSDRDLLEHRWEMGDGTVTEWYTGAPSISYVYVDSGTYEVNLTVRDDDGTFKQSINIDVDNIAPVASLKASSRTVEKDSEIRFDSTGSMDSQSDMNSLYYIWDMGDGHIIEGSSRMSYVYRAGGTYPVTVTVVDDDDDTDSEKVIITVIDRPPLVMLDIPSLAITGSPVTFDASGTIDTVSDLSNLTYSFDPGDGSNMLEGRDPVVEHTYLIPGKYEIRLMVSDGLNEEELTRIIMVKENETTESFDNDSSFLLFFTAIIVTVMVIIILVAAVLIIMKKRPRNSISTTHGRMPTPSVRTRIMISEGPQQDGNLTSPGKSEGYPPPPKDPMNTSPSQPRSPIR